MSTPFLIITLLFCIVAVSMILIILVQRPQGGGLAGAFGGAGGGGTETIFGGRVGDALTWATVVAFVVYLGVAITLNKLESTPGTAATTLTVTDQFGEGVQIERIDPPFQQNVPFQDQPGTTIEPFDPSTLDPSQLPPELRDALQRGQTDPAAPPTEDVPPVDGSEPADEAPAEDEPAPADDESL